MTNHPNRRKTKACNLTKAQRSLLSGLVDIMKAGDWTAGDYCLTQAQFDALMRARAELKNPSGDAVDHYEERQCKDCGNAICNNETGRCLTCQDAIDLRETGKLRG